MVDERETVAGEIFGGVPSIRPDIRFTDPGGEVETADNEGDGGCTCTLEDDTFMVRDWRFPTAGIFTGSEVVLGSPSVIDSG